MAPTEWALGLFVVAVALGWCAGRPSVDDRQPAAQRFLTSGSWLCSLVASALLVVQGAVGLSGLPGYLDLDLMSGLGVGGLRVDPVSGLFLVIAFGAAIPTLTATLTDDAARRPRLSAAVAMTLAASALIVTANNLFLLLAGWELLGFAFYLVVGYDRHLSGRTRAAVLTAGFSKVSGAFLLIGGLLLSRQAGTWTLSELGGHLGPVSDVAYALLVAGFAIKAGLMPAHIWLPPAYSAAPGVARAVLAGVSVNVGFYGLWRTLHILGAPPIWLACLVLLVAAASAILGISHAAVHAELTGLISWSSVENAGLIVTGYGVAMVGALTQTPQLTSVGLLAGTAQICAHTAAKSLFFVSAASVEQAMGTVDLDRLRGVVRRLPFAGTGLVVAAFTLAGMPLTAGFASEWLTLEALMQQFRLHNLALQVCLAIAGVLVALTVGVAGIAFVRLVALTAFGHPATPLITKPAGYPLIENAWPHRIGVLALCLFCLGLAVCAPLEVTVIAAGLQPIVGATTYRALADPLILQPVYDSFSALSPSLLWIVIPGYLVVIMTLAAMISRLRLIHVRFDDAWKSGSGGVVDGHGYTSYAFANPIRKVLATVLMTRHELKEEEASLDPFRSPHGARAGVARLGYTVDVIDVVEHYLFAPLHTAIQAIVRISKRLQSGRLDAYMAYMLIAVLVVITVVVALASG